MAECDERFGILSTILDVYVEANPNVPLTFRASQFFDEIAKETPLMYPRRRETALTVTHNRFLGNTLVIAALPHVSLELLSEFKTKLIVTCTDGVLEKKKVPKDCTVFNFPATFDGSLTVKMMFCLTQSICVYKSTGKLVGPRRNVSFRRNVSSCGGTFWALGQTQAACLFR